MELSCKQRFKDITIDDSETIDEIEKFFKKNKKYVDTAYHILKFVGYTSSIINIGFSTVVELVILLNPEMTHQEVDNESESLIKIE